MVYSTIDPRIDEESNPELRITDARIIKDPTALSLEAILRQKQTLMNFLTRDFQAKRVQRINIDPFVIAFIISLHKEEDGTPLEVFKKSRISSF